MVYPSNFHKLVMIGTIYSDIFNVTLSIIPDDPTPLPAVSDALLSAVSTVVEDWWDNAYSGGGGLSIISSAKLTSVKLNRIGPNGKYVDPGRKEKVLATPIAGGGTGVMPSQLSIVSTLRGDNERAPAGKGRMYFPPSFLCTNALGADGRLTTANATLYAQGTGKLLQDLEAAYASLSVHGIPGIASKAGAGAFQVVRSVSVGRTVDTMRSRRNKILEDPSKVII